MPTALEDFLLSKGGARAIIRDGSYEEFRVVSLCLNKVGDDRFSTHALCFVEDGDDGKTIPTVYVSQQKIRGLTIIAHADLIRNHNDLHTTAKENYLKLLKELDEAHVPYQLNQEGINL